MYPINKKKCLHKFKAVRILSGRDLFARLGERIPNDRGILTSRNPAVRHDMANDVIMDGFSKLQETPDMTNIPPALVNEQSEE